MVGRIGYDVKNVAETEVQFSPLTDWVVGGLGGGGEDKRDDSAETLLQSFRQEAIVSSSGMGRDVHSLTLSIQHFLY